MNETAIGMEEQIISLFSGMETLIRHGWILKKIKRQELLFLSDGNLPEKYKHAGFNRIYLYRCYQQEEKSSKKQEEKSSQKQKGLGSGFTE